jgi:uncharacterized protein YndB with AHSA1/START domain
VEQVERTVVLDATPEDVWRAVTDEAELAEWFGGEVTLDPEPGGRGRFDEPGAPTRHAVVEEVDEGRRLVWRWWPDGGAPATRVALTVDAVPGGTRLTVVEAPLAMRASAGDALLAARGAAWDRRLLALELRCLVPAYA